MGRAFLFLCLSFILGVGLSSFFNLNIFSFYILAIVSVMLWSVWWKNPKLRMVGFCGLVILFGMWRYQTAILKIDARWIQFYNDKEEISFQGKIVGEPDVRQDQIKLKVKSQKFKVNELNASEKELDISNSERWFDVRGNVLVTVPRYPEYNYGDELEVKCKLKAPAEFEDFSYKNYLARFDIYSVCYRGKIKLLSQDHGNKIYAALLALKHKFKDIIDISLPEPQSSFLAALILGIRRGLPKYLIDSFSITGTSHIIAISGLHVTIIVGLIVKLTENFPRKISFLIVSFIIIAFVIITGAKPSIIRASAIGLLAIFATNVGRLSNPRNALALVASGIILANPKILRFDIGFQLSFLAVLGIVYVLPIFRKALKFIPEMWGVRELFLVTLSAQVATIPLIMYNFERFSLIAPIVNVLILPLLSIVMILGLGIIFSGALVLFLAKILGWVSWLFLGYIIIVVTWFSRLSFASFEIQDIWSGWIWIYYVGLFVFVWWMRKKDLEYRI